nr:Chromate resistance protein ChrB [Streptomyces sp. 3214.6]
MPVFADGIGRAITLRERAGGQAMSLNASGRSAEDAARFRVLYTAARSAYWPEFLSACGTLERPRRRHRDVFAAPHRTPAPHRTSEGQQ